MTPDDTSLKMELAALRRRTRVLSVAAVCALLLATASLLESVRHRPGQTPDEADQGVLVGRSLYLREDPERPYVRLRFLTGGAGLILADAEGRGQAQLTASADRGVLALGSAPARLLLDADPAAPSLTLRDGQGRPRILLTAGDVARVALFDPDGRPRLELTSGPEGPAVSFSDASGVRRLLLTQHRDEAHIRIRGPRGEVAYEAPPAR